LRLPQTFLPQTFCAIADIVERLALARQFRQQGRMRVLVLAALLFTLALPARAETIVGQGRAIDGDTLVIDGRRVRLFGVNAPDGQQLCQLAGKPYRCGQEAAFALDKLISKRTITCDLRGTDRWEASMAVCFADRQDLGAAMVRQGWAVAYMRYSGIYAKLEDTARRERRGMWAGAFEMPWDSRALQWAKARVGEDSLSTRIHVKIGSSAGCTSFEWDNDT
jgi:endonuclease YncB( thermonuclease family)